MRTLLSSYNIRISKKFEDLIFELEVSNFSLVTTIRNLMNSSSKCFKNECDLLENSKNYLELMRTPLSSYSIRISKKFENLIFELEVSNFSLVTTIRNLMNTSSKCYQNECNLLESSKNYLELMRTLLSSYNIRISKKFENLIFVLEVSNFSLVTTIRNLMNTTS